MCLHICTCVWAPRESRSGHKFPGTYGDVGHWETPDIGTGNGIWAFLKSFKCF